SMCTLLSASAFVVFSWYLSQFAALWLNNGVLNSKLLVLASVFLAGRYIFAHMESRLNFKAGNMIVANIKKELYPVLLKENQLDSTAGALYMTKISDDL